MSETTTTGIKLSADVKARILAIGKKMDRSPHWIMKTAVETYIAREERYWREREEDLAEWEDYLLTGNGVPHHQVDEWLASIGSPDEKECPA